MVLLTGAGTLEAQATNSITVNGPVQGGGSLGKHDIGTVAVHYTDAYSAYGPIVAAQEGVSWFTLRNAWDPGARYMPAHRQQLRDARARWQHREATCGPLPPLSGAELGALTRPNTPKEFSDFRDSQIAFFAEMVKSANIRIE